MQDGGMLAPGAGNVGLRRQTWDGAPHVRAGLVEVAAVAAAAAAAATGCRKLNHLQKKKEGKKLVKLKKKIPVRAFSVD